MTSSLLRNILKLHQTLAQSCHLLDLLLLQVTVLPNNPYYWTCWGINAKKLAGKILVDSSKHVRRGPDMWSSHILTEYADRKWNVQIRAVVPVNKLLFQHQWRSRQADMDFSRRRRRRLPLTAEADLTMKVCFFFGTVVSENAMQCYFCLSGSTFLCSSDKEAKINLAFVILSQLFPLT